MKMNNNINKFKKITIDDLIIKESLGKGRFGQVFLVFNKLNNKKYAWKVINKVFINKFQKSHYIIMEKNLLSHFEHSKIVKLYSTFQDSNNLYFLLEYIPGGCLSKYINLKCTLELEEIRFLASEIMKILIYLRHNGVIHKDIKPENLLWTKKMGIKLIDFGTSKIINNDINLDLINILKKNKIYYNSNKSIFNFENNEEKDFWNRNSVAGSPFYISPEVLNNNSVHYSSDYWSLGIMVYKMSHGNFPFNDDYISYIDGRCDLNIKNDLDNDLKDFIRKLLIINPLERLGMNENNNEYSFDAFINHSFLKKYNLSNYNLNKNLIHLKEVNSPLFYKSNKDIKIININLDLKLKNNTKSCIINTLKVVLFKGYIKVKKFKIFNIIRYFILHSDGKLLIYTKNKKQLKEKILINKNTKLEKNKNIVKITNDSKKYKIIIAKDNKYNLLNSLIHVKNVWLKKSCINF